MKTALYLLLLTPTITATGCFTLSHKEQIQSLEAVGMAAKLTIDTAAVLLEEEKISLDKFQVIANFYDTRFQPAYREALKRVEGNKNNPAPLKLVSLASELSLLLTNDYSTIH